MNYIKKNLVYVPIIMLAVLIWGIYDKYTFNQNLWDEAAKQFGSISFPTSLDTLTNPSGTDSVATVSHSAQHANANDAIEAIEAKIGTGASTPTSGTLFYGNGIGSSAWNANPSITSLKTSGGLYASSTSIFDGGLYAIASSTFNAPFRLPSISQGGLYVGTGGLLGSFATTTAVCSGNATCAAFTAIGSTPVNIAVGASNTTFYVSTSTTAIYAAIGPISVVSGDQFLIFGKGGIDPAGSDYIQIRVLSPNYTASTTLDQSGANGTEPVISVSSQAYYKATTTGTVWFDLNSIGTVGTNPVIWTSLIVEKL